MSSVNNGSNENPRNNNNYDTNQQTEKLLKVKNQVELLKGTMHENINLALTNTVKIEDIEQKAQGLTEDSYVFRNGAKRLKTEIWWKRVKLWLFIGGIICIILAILITVIVLSSQNNKNSRRLFENSQNIFTNYVFGAIVNLAQFLRFPELNAKYLKEDVVTYGNLRVGLH